MLNNIVLCGRLVKDPELRLSGDGTELLPFTIACERDYKSRASDKREVDYIDIEAWKENARFVAANFRKGDAIQVTGRLKTRVYEKDGVKHRVSYVEAERAYFSGTKRTEGPF